jgi:hypothetical protein
MIAHKKWFIVLIENGFYFRTVYLSFKFFAFDAALIAFLSPEAIFSAPTFLPLVGQPYFALNIEQLEQKPVIKKMYIIFFIILILFDTISTY